jgi:signal peptidase I
MAQPDMTTWVPPRQPPERRIWRIAFWVLFGLAAVLLVTSIAIPIATIRPYHVPSISMENTVLPGDEIFVASGSGMRRGDVVVLRVPVAVSGDSGLFVKRLIGLPGDHVACCSRGHVTVDGKPLGESYLYPGDPPSRITFSVTLGRGQIWVMGDHRKFSSDSQGWGPVPASGVVGRVVLVGHGFSFTAPRTPQTFVTDGLAPADTRSDVYVILAVLAAGSALTLLVLAITGITRFMIRQRRSRTALRR